METLIDLSKAFGWLAAILVNLLIAWIVWSLHKKFMNRDDCEANRKADKKEREHFIQLLTTHEQAVREVYQRPFEIACKRYVMNGVMGSMNRVGMSWFHYGLYNTMLRDEWGWNGMLITDSDGASGDVYNTPQCILAVRGGMLAFNAYPDDPSTVAVFGDATSTVLGRHQLHLLMRDALFQYCGTKTVDGSGNAAGGVTAAASGSSGDVPVAGIAGGVLLAAAAVAAGLAVRARKKKAAPADAPQAPRDEDEDDGSQE